MVSIEEDHCLKGMHFVNSRSGTSFFQSTDYMPMLKFFKWFCSLDVGARKLQLVSAILKDSNSVPVIQWADFATQ